MLKGIRIGIFIIFCFLLSTLLAAHLSGKKITMVNLFSIIKSEITQRFSKPVPTEAISTTANSDLESLPTSVHGLRSHDSCISESATWRPNPTKGKACRDWSEGKIRPKRVNGVYTWVDGNGQQHFSNIKPTDFEFSEHTLGGSSNDEAFLLRISGDAMPKHFTEKINGKMSRVFSLYGDLLGHHHLKKTVLNLRFIKSRKNFSRLYSRSNPSAANRISGFYRGNNNQSTILVRNLDSAMNTAVHESIHALNRSLIGFVPRWLNEGMAEYAENIQVVLQLGIIKPTFYNLRQNGKLVSIERLISASDKEWQGSIQEHLYNTSNAFVFFMMDNPERRQRLVRLLAAERGSLCEQLNESAVKELLGVKSSSLQRQFSAWLRQTEYQEHRI